MTTVLSELCYQTNENCGISVQNKLLEKFELTYNQIINTVNQQTRSGVLPQLFHQYHLQISDLVKSYDMSSLKNGQEGEKPQKDVIEAQDNKQIVYFSEQPSYMFLRRAWETKGSFKNMLTTIDYDPEDHIDRINKAVAMIRQQTVYMTKKQTYLYQKDQSNNFLIGQNPFFIRIKQQLQMSQMQNQQLLQKFNIQAQTIQRITKEKLLLQKSLKSLKRKFQELEKSWIEVSKKNISLQQEALVMKSQSSKYKKNVARESCIGQVYKDDEIMNKESVTIHHNKKPTQQQQEQQKQLQKQWQQQSMVTSVTDNLNNNNKATEINNILKPLQNIIIDIKSDSASNSPKSSCSFTKASTQNNSNSIIKENCSLEDVTEKVNTQNSNNIINRSTNNNTNNTKNHELLEFSHSDKVITEVTELKFKNLRYQASPRKALLSSARSVDLASKTSLNKPKFERTKPNIQQTLIKSLTKDNFININIEKPTIIKNQLNMNCQSPTLVKTSFKNSPTRGFISRREEVKWQ